MRPHYTRNHQQETKYRALVRSDWLVRLWISFAIYMYLQATREKNASQLSKYPPLATSTPVNSC